MATECECARRWEAKAAVQGRSITEVMAEQIVLRDHALTASRAEAERLRALVDDAVDAWLGGVSADLEMPMRALEAALAGGKP